VAAERVWTDYWLKLDTDIVATGNDDWINPDWFVDDPAIVSAAWSYTKPPDQMVKLDRWAELHRDVLGIVAEKPPLNLVPKPGEVRLRHKRIISWCAFFQATLTALCAGLAKATCGPGQLPVPSQDGYMFYVAKRLGLPIMRTNMKALGWEQWHTEHNIREAVERAMK